MAPSVAAKSVCSSEVISLPRSPPSSAASGSFLPGPCQTTVASGVLSYLGTHITSFKSPYFALKKKKKEIPLYLLISLKYNLKIIYNDLVFKREISACAQIILFVCLLDAFIPNCIPGEHWVSRGGCLFLLYAFLFFLFLY